MEYNGYVSLETIGDKLLRHPLMRGISYEAIIDYAIDFMRIVGVPSIFTEKVTTIKVDKYRALLPEDYYQMNQVRKGEDVLTYSLDSFHFSNNSCNTYTYKIQGNIVYTSFEEASLWEDRHDRNPEPALTHREYRSGYGTHCLHGCPPFWQYHPQQ